MEKNIDEEKKQNNPKKYLFISGIPPTFEEEDLKSLLKDFVEISNIIFKMPEQLSENIPKIAKLEVESEKIYKLLLEKKILRSKDRNYEIKIEEYLEGSELVEKDEEVQKRKITVLRILGEVDEEKMKRAFSQIGEVELAYARSYPDNPSKSLGFVTFVNEESVEKALKLSGQLAINGRTVKIRRFLNKNIGEPRKRNKDNFINKKENLEFELESENQDMKIIEKMKENEQNAEDEISSKFSRKAIPTVVYYNNLSQFGRGYSEFVNDMYLYRTLTRIGYPVYLTNNGYYGSYPDFPLIARILDSNHYWLNLKFRPYRKY